MQIPNDVESPRLYRFPPVAFPMLQSKERIVIYLHSINCYPMKNAVQRTIQVAQ